MSAVLQPPPDPALAALHDAYARLRAGFEAERDPPYAARIDRLRRLEAMLSRLAAPMAEAVSADFGHRPAQVTRLADIMPVQLAIRHARHHLRGWMKPRRAATPLVYRPGRSFVMRQPLGVVGVVSPWNYPGLLALAPVIAALAAGNRVLVKPSEIGPRFAALLREHVAQAFSADEMRVITGDAEVGRALVALPLDHLLFTGSTTVGRQVALAAAANLTPVTLELGGKSPAIVSASADLALAAERIAAGKLLNAGQTCVAPDYALVPRARLDDFVAALRRAARRLYPRVAGNADYTSIASDRHFARLLALLDDARAQGAQVLPLHDEPLDAGGRRLAPAVVLGAGGRTRLMQEEIFGPILPLLPYDTVDEAIAHVNRGERPLALYWFGDDTAERDRVLRQTLAGGVTVNDTLFHFVIESLPCGGVGASGIGAYHGEWGFRRFSKETGVFVQGRFAGGWLLYPPYGKRFERVIDWVRRLG